MSANQPQPEHDEVRDVIVEAVEAAGFRVATDDEFAAILAAGEEAASQRDDEARAEGRRFLSEEEDRDVIDGWYAEAERMTLAVLPAFLEGLTKAYRHDYGTVCHAIAAAAIAAANAVEKSPQGGITGFQAGAVMWVFVRHWDHLSGPARMVKYENMLFPQYADHFGAISQSLWAWVQEEARKKLAEHPDRGAEWLTNHWQSIVDGVVPFGLRLEES